MDIRVKKTKRAIQKAFIALLPFHYGKFRRSLQELYKKILELFAVLPF